jgi:hypothetical protein
MARGRHLHVVSILQEQESHSSFFQHRALGMLGVLVAAIKMEMGVLWRQPLSLACHGAHRAQRPLIQGAHRY